MDTCDNLSNFSEQIAFPSYDAFPDIELYMDQVIDFLSRSRVSLRANDKLSPAMVNNYIKAELMPRAHGKKYSREHLIHLAVIARLKQVLSVIDTGTLIRAGREDKTDEEFFESFRQRADEAAEEISSVTSDDGGNPADIAMEFAVRSYLYKVACEHILDGIGTTGQKKPVKSSHEKKPSKSDQKKSEKTAE